MPQRLLPLIVPAALSVVLAACAGSRPDERPPLLTDVPDRAAVRESSPAAAVIAGQPVTRDELTPLLEELAGGQVIEEVALDRLLRNEARRRGVRIAESDVEAERRNLLETMQADAGVSEEAAGRLLEQQRRQRGLGPRRFRALLERNALLRALSRDGVEPTEAEIALAHRIREGERRVVRIIAMPDERRLALLRDTLLAGEPATLSIRFAESAVDVSTAPSGAAGGMLDPLSTADPAYPEAIRTAAAALEPGQVSPVIPVGDSVVIVLLERVLPPSGRTLEQTREGIARSLRVRKERLAMERLARELLERGEVSVLDRDIGWSWDARRGLPG